MKKIINSALCGSLLTVVTCIMVVVLFKFIGNTTLDHPKTYWPIAVLWLIMSLWVWASKTLIENARNGH